MMSKLRWHCLHSLFVVVITCLWILLSASLVLVNKYILTVNRFTHVCTLSLCHMTVASALSATCLRSAPDLMKSTIRATMHAKFFMIGLLFALSLVCATQALTVMDVSSIQMLKTINPAVIYMMGLSIGIEEFSAAVTGSILVVCAGVAMTVYGANNFTAYGIALQLVSVFLDSARWACLQQIMQDEQVRLTPLRTLSFIAPNAAIILLAAASYLEMSELLRDSNGLTHMYWVIGSSILAFMLNLCSFEFIRATSALTMSVTGVIKDVLLMLASGFMFDTHVSVTQARGYMTAVVGLCIYNHLKNRTKIK